MGERGLGGGSDEKAISFSTTNVQVDGVDEADTVKNDGKYIYIASRDKISIFEAYPAEKMKKISEIRLFRKSEDWYSEQTEMYLKNNDLVVITTEYTKTFKDNKNSERCELIEKCPADYYEHKTMVYTYDISNKINPVFKDSIIASGDYIDSRMIGDHVYVLTSQYITDGAIFPSIKKNDNERIIRPTEILYNTEVDDEYLRYMGVLAIDVKDGSTTGQITLAGESQEVYVSDSNLYITDYESYGDFPGSKEEDKRTNIYRISIDKNEIEYSASGTVKGWVKDHFSMDEYNGNLRVATTDEEYRDGETISLGNNLYVLNEDLDIIGSLEGLASGEKIYSTRFVEKKAYVVTFKEVDPLFVIDLKNPKKPYVLGELKIPGYSEYLHPYDENHLIGLGMDTAEGTVTNPDGETESTILNQGVKMSLFDVTDGANPKELHSIIIGDRGSNSDALRGHKSFQFNKNNGILVLPIEIAELEGEEKSSEEYGNTVLNGAQVYHVSPKDGFRLIGNITHFNSKEVEALENDIYIDDYKKEIDRTIFMDDYIYTISPTIIKANKLWDLKELFYSEL